MGKMVCHMCVGEKHLSGLIAKEGAPGTCSYCGNVTEPCIQVEALADHIEGAFERHYVRTSTDPNDFEWMMLRDKESNYDWERHGEPVVYAIAGAAHLNEVIAKDVAALLEDRHSDFEMAQIGEECPFSTDSYYERLDDEGEEFGDEWNEIERSLKNEARFFNRDAQDFLERLFDGLHHRATHNRRPAIVNLNPGTRRSSFFRARVIHDEAELKKAIARPDTGLGPPPAHMARAGRMNAHGVSVFYGATQKSVALAEVRPPVGSTVVVAEFQITRPVRLLDVEALRSIFVAGSIFDPNYHHQLGLAKFMKRLAARVAMPVMPHDEEAGYLITQVIADYLALRSEPPLDGMLFPSVQVPGRKKNVVLFHHASRVEDMQLPAGTEVRASLGMSTEEGWEEEYTVWEETPPAPAEGKPPSADAAQWNWFVDSDLASRPSETREVTLRVVNERISVHHVSAVKFKTHEHAVTRHRMSKTTDPF